MKKHFVINLICCCFALCLLLAGCGRKEEAPAAPAPVAFSSGEIARDAASVTLVLADGETALLDELENLRTANLSGSANLEEIRRWADAHPAVDVTYTIPLPTGEVLDNHTKTLDLSDRSGSELRSLLPALSQLPALKTLRLGSERTGLDWSDVIAVHEALPETELRYSFTLYGQPCDLSNTTVNLSHVPVDDNAVQIEQAMAMMPHLTYVDMDTCGVPNERMAQLRDEYPDVQVVWRVWFGDQTTQYFYSVRTDVEMILASKPSWAGPLTSANTDGLNYCTEVRFLDIGHNGSLTDISFVRNMPKLSTLILAGCGVSDISPLADCPDLEYLEIFSTYVSDLTPLSGLKELRHLNIVNCMELTDISPLFSLTELDRLWVGSMTRVSNEQVEEMRRCAPGCEVSTASYADPTSDGWRYDRDANQVPRYWLLREQFKNYRDSSYSFASNDPLY